MARSKKKRKAEFQTYALRIEDWELSYSFSVDVGEWTPGPYWEHSELTITGQFRFPPTLAERRCKVQIMGNRADTKAMRAPESAADEPLGVGGFTIRGTQSDYVGTIPDDALWGLVTALGHHRINYVTMFGEPLKRGRARVRSIDFVREVDPEDYE